MLVRREPGAFPAVWMPRYSDWAADSAIIRAMAELGVETIEQKRHWEWGVCAVVIDELASDCAVSALGVGVGNEPLIPFVRRRFNKVVLTDIWSKEWLMQTGRPGDDAGSMVCADATVLPFTDMQFDLVWSVSSIEHFGNRYDFRGKAKRRVRRLIGQLGFSRPRDRGATSRSLREIARVLKPRGCAVVSTEIILNQRQDEEFFGLLEFLRLAREAGLEPANDIASICPDIYFLDHVLARSRMKAWNDPLPHVYLDWEGVLFTSCVFTLNLAEQPDGGA